MLNRVLRYLPHKHHSVRRDGVGIILMCHSFNRVLHIGFRRDMESPAYHVPYALFQDLVDCETWEQAMALLRTA